MGADDADAALMERVARGDQAAFAVLFERHQAAVVRFAFRFVGSRARAEELAQDIFIKLYRTAGNYRPSAKFTTFLYRVATNHCLNEKRRGEWKAEAPMDPNDAVPLHPAGGARPDEALEGQELEAAVGRALGAMSERERAAFSLCRFEGLPYRDIAEAMDATEPAVKSLIHRATLQVMKQLELLKAGLTGADVRRELHA